MTFDAALRATEILLAIAFLQQSAEFFYKETVDRWIYLIRIACCIALLFGIFTPWVLGGLAALSLVMLHRFQGPYNGGSDRMSVLILWCLLLAQLMPSALLPQAVFGYLAVQLTLSYFISGWVKLLNSEWRNGRALSDVFAFSAYPVSESLRGLSKQTNLLWGMSWAVILFEVLFPISLVSQPTLIAALCIAALFHLANACLFGLNRFLWVWLAAYPSLLWFQAQLVGVLF